MRRSWALVGGAALLASACAGFAQMVIKSPPSVAAPEQLPSGLNYIAGFELSSPLPAFGGLSGLALSGDGARALAVTDKGRWVQLALAYSDDRLVDVDIEAIRPILGPDGAPLSSDRRDIEAIVADDDLKQIVLSTEGSHRLMAVNLRTDDWRSRTETVAGPALFEGLGINKGLEALARRASDGALIAISEGTLPDEDDHAGWIVDGAGEGARFSVSRIGRYKPTDLAQGPDGRFYLLERRFSLLAGFWIRLRRFEADAFRPGVRAEGTMLGEIGPPDDIDNMEGLALRRGADGRTYIFMLSDDNFSALQRTLLLQFAVEE